MMVQRLQRKDSYTMKYKKMISVPQNLANGFLIKKPQTKISFTISIKPLGLRVISAERTTLQITNSKSMGNTQRRRSPFGSRKEDFGKNQGIRYWQMFVTVECNWKFLRKLQQISFVSWWTVLEKFDPVFDLLSVVLILGMSMINKIFPQEGVILHILPE